MDCATIFDDAFGDLKRKRAGASKDTDALHRTVHGRSSALFAVLRRAQRSLAALANEREDFLHGGVAGEFLGDILDALAQRAFSGEQQAVGAAEIVNIVAGERRAAAGRRC